MSRRRIRPCAVYVPPPEAFRACEFTKPSDSGEYGPPGATDLLVHAGYEVETAPFDGRKINTNTERDLKRAERRLREK